MIHIYWYLFISWLTFVLSPVFGCYENAAVNIRVQVFVWTCFQFPWVYTSQSGTAGSYSNLMFNSVELPDCFPKQLHHFTLLLAAVHLGSNSPTSLSTLAILACEKWHLIVILTCVSQMTNEWCWKSFRVLLAIWFLFEEMSTRVLCLFLNWLIYPFYCWIVRVLYTLWIPVPYLHIFSSILWLLFSFSW